jgi:C1A family cysteine protease
MFSGLKKLFCALILISTTPTIAMDYPSTSESSSGNVQRKYTLKFSTAPHNHPLLKYENSHNRIVLPVEVDMRPECPPVYDQLNIGSCASQACGAAAAYILKNQPSSIKFTPSALFLYYNTRVKEESVDLDSGTTIEGVVWSLAKHGVAPEADMPYIDDKIAFRMPPSKIAYANALQYMNLDNLSLSRVSQDAYTIKSILANRIPIICGLQIYSSFESLQVMSTGIIPIPNTKIEKYLGGHAVMLTGYNTSKGVFYGRNSWGIHWGQSGYFEIPESFILNSKLADDFWKIEKIGPKSSDVKSRISSLPEKSSFIFGNDDLDEDNLDKSI